MFEEGPPPPPQPPKTPLEMARGQLLDAVRQATDSYGYPAFGLNVGPDLVGAIETLIDAKLAEALG